MTNMQQIATKLGVPIPSGDVWCISFLSKFVFIHCDCPIPVAGIILKNYRVSPRVFQKLKKLPKYKCKAGGTGYGQNHVRKKLLVKLYPILTECHTFCKCKGNLKLIMGQISHSFFLS